MRRSKFHLILFFALIFILFIHPIEGDGDFYHHIHTGKYILTHFSLPHFDEWTFTASGQPWVAYSWATGLLFFLIYQTLGVGGISLFVAAVGLISVFLTYLLLKSYRLEEKFIHPLLLLLVSLLLVRFPARPEIFAYPLLISILIIDRLGTKYPRVFWLFPPVILLWSIFYGANVLVGLGLLVLLILKRLPHPPNILLVAILLAILVSLFNGYSLDTIFYILKISKISQIQGEWLGIWSLFKKAPADFLDLFKFRLAIYATFLSLYLYLVITHIRLIRNNFQEFLLSLGIFLPFFTFRQVPMATILTLPSLSLILNSYKKVDLKSALVWVLASISFLLTLFYNPPGLELKEDPARIKLASFILNNGLSGNAYTSQQIGSYLSFKFYPKILISYDTRDDLFIRSKFLKDVLSDPPLELILNRYKADLIILDLNEDSQKVNYILHSPNWTKIYLEDNFLVMMRK